MKSEMNITKNINSCRKDGRLVSIAERTSAMSTDTTPTPWRVVPDTLGSIEGPDGTSVAQCQQTRPVKSAQDHAERLANARLIVQAVNKRESLLAERDALRSALKAIVEFCDDPDGSLAPESLALGLSRLLVPARAALKGGK